MNTVTQRVKTELSQIQPTATTPVSARRAQVSSMLRFGGGLRQEDGRTWIESEFDTRDAGVWLRDEITSVYGVPPRMIAMSDTRFLVYQTRSVEELAVQTGLLDKHGRRVVGMPVEVVAGSPIDAAAALRGAFLARGRIILTARRVALEVTCPTAAAALALIGFARRQGVQAWMREATRSGERLELVVVPEARAVTALLTRIGAPGAAQTLLDNIPEQTGRGHPSVMQAANRDRWLEQALSQAKAVERAVALIGDELSPHVAYVAQLRIAHPTASFNELARLTDPPVTKNVVAGRLRTVLNRAARLVESSDPSGVA